MIKKSNKVSKQKHTMAVRVTAIAKCDPPKPSCKPTAKAKAVTVAECDEGIPPDPTSRFRSHLLSLYLQKKNLHHSFISSIIKFYQMIKNQKIF